MLELIAGILNVETREEISVPEDKNYKYWVNKIRIWQITQPHGNPDAWVMILGTNFIPTFELRLLQADSTLHNIILLVIHHLITFYVT